MHTYAKRQLSDSSSIEWAMRDLLARGYDIDSDPEIIRAMPWSKVTRLTTSRGPVFLKEMAQIFSLEPLLIQMLSSWAPNHLPKGIVINETLNCFLMDDAGVSLRTFQKGKFQGELMSNALKVYAQIQLKSINHVQDLMDMGIPDWRLTKIPALFEQLMLQKKLLEDDGLTQSEIKMLQSSQGEVLDLCGTLSNYNIPETIETMDFQDNNVLMKEGHITIADWGDAVIAHPFFSLEACLNSAKRNHGLQENDEIYRQLHNMYLDQWLDFASKDHLWDAFGLAKKLRKIQVALSFARAKTGANLDSSENFVGYIANPLRDFISVAI